MVLSRYRAPVAAPPNFVLVDTANCRTFLEFGSSGKFFRQKYILPAHLRLLLLAFPHFTPTESHNQTNATRRTA